MTQSVLDDARLRATEAQMRRALGLAASTQARSAPIHTTSATYGSHRQRRRFVRDGDVPVLFIRRNRQPDRETGTNKRDPARQAMQFHAATRELFER
jgi:hypothetical protein